MSSVNRLQMQLLARDSWSQARATTFSTLHGTIETPIFMPVATQAALRGLDPDIAAAMDFKILLANTYHLLLRPGPEIISKFGGIQKFMRWPGSILTDSGGYQLFSLSRQLKIDEAGATFRSYVDGKKILLSPESSIQTQRLIGSDIMMVLDQCVSSTSDESVTRRAVELTSRWAKRSFEARGDSPQALFGIIQGACNKTLRHESAAHITAIPFDGFAIGGLAVGESKSEREDIAEYTAELMPPDRPRYLMGVGTPIDLLEAVKRGLDMFDCILPTSLGHQGVCYTSMGKVDLRRGVYRSSEFALDTNCKCSTCSRFSRAYLHHLIRADEYVAGQYLSIHNLNFYQNLMSEIRQSILTGQFEHFYKAKRDILMSSDIENQPVPPKRRPVTRPNDLGNYEIVANPNGYSSIRHRVSGEVMHSVIDPALEAKTLYLDQSNIIETAQTPGPSLVVWDVGLGAATNAMLLVKAAEASPGLLRDINLISFERDLDSLRLALSHAHAFKHLHHSAPHTLLENRAWQSVKTSLKWTLCLGEFQSNLDKHPEPDIIWFDPFSYKVDTELWTTEMFAAILNVCASKATKLYTYSASTAVRASMLAAGWYVGVGQGTGPKSETTIAYSPLAVQSNLSLQLLGKEWLTRWERSDAKHPLGKQVQLNLSKVSNHPQFT